MEDLKGRIAHNLSEYRVARGAGSIGSLTIALDRAVTRTLRAHWTGFKLFYPGPVLVLRAELSDGRFWSEGYISTSQPSWVLVFRNKPHSARGSSGRPRPDDELAHPQYVQTALEQRRRHIEAGLITEEELIRMEDLDSPLESIDEFFNYTSLYILKSIDATWAQMGYSVDPSLPWQEYDYQVASVPFDAAIQEGLKKSDIIWITPDTQPRRPIPCWFVLKDSKVYVLSGERQQRIPNATAVRDVDVVTRWKGRDVRLVDFSAAVRIITPADPEFEEIASLMINKRQSVVGSPEEVTERWKRDCLILELTPRV